MNYKIIKHDLKQRIRSGTFFTGEFSVLKLFFTGNIQMYMLRLQAIHLEFNVKQTV